MSFSPYGSPGPEDRRPEPAGQPLLPVSELPPRPVSPGARAGRAYGVLVRQESQVGSNQQTLGLTVLEFRLAEPGNPQPLDVLMRGRSLSGTVRDGDWIELAGPADATNRWNVATVQNLTTGSTVVVVGGRPNKVVTAVVLSLVGVLMLGVVLLMIGLFAVGSS
ncbi:hypothetical protein SAMN04488544_3471 [Microlunatus sagamiharensis]|uniref:Uncharacterized protein n=1 Tax=Microlunatus sagamiharensis TaxID=546874 RepID=A0A1H2N7N0_9ACTN|nr:hypothetical protein [Microlunatus sagamiharensis]SDV01392.1 hypothetical protein SAMN04488544_3471 [Microlunatus sagamiharensis]